MNRIKTGTVTGTGATININCGFIPSHVKVINETGLAVLEWSKTMAAGKGLKTITAGTISFIATLGITVSDSDDSFIGFKIGADTDVNVAAEELHWIASADR